MSIIVNVAWDREICCLQILMKVIFEVDRLIIECFLQYNLRTSSHADAPFYLAEVSMCRHLRLSEWWLRFLIFAGSSSSRRFELIHLDIILCSLNMEMKESIVTLVHGLSTVLDSLTLKYCLQLLHSSVEHHCWLFLRLSQWEKIFKVYLWRGKVLMVRVLFLG